MKHVREHISRCIELWSNAEGNGVQGKRVSRDTYEMMRSDLMILVGIAMALSAEPEGMHHVSPKSPF